MDGEWGVDRLGGRPCCDSKVVPALRSRRRSQGLHEGVSGLLVFAKQKRVTRFSGGRGMDRSITKDTGRLPDTARLSELVAIAPLHHVFDDGP